MNKIISLIGAVTLAATVCVQAYTTTVVIPANGFTNVIPNISGLAVVKQVILTAPTNSAVNVQIYDALTNSITYVVPAYTNTVSYATNGAVVAWTNYYGVINYSTNFALVDVTNNVVASTTNSYPIKIALSTAASTSTRIDNANYWFSQGVWATNTTGVAETLTVTYQQ